MKPALACAAVFLLATTVVGTGHSAAQPPDPFNGTWTRNFSKRGMMRRLSDDGQSYVSAGITTDGRLGLYRWMDRVK